MSKNNNYKKIPSLFPRQNMSNPNIKNDSYIYIGSLTPRFNNIYTKYINSKKKTIYPNIRSILNEYRAEKLKKLNEQEAMREEIGQEIKKYKDAHELLKRKNLGTDKNKYYENFEKKNKKKQKENKGIILDTFYRYESKTQSKKRIKNKNLKINLISPFKIFQKNKNSFVEKIRNKHNNKTEVYFNKKKIVELLESKIKEKSRTKDSKKIKIKECWIHNHHKINAACDSITDDSIKVKINGRKTMDKFNNSWNKYKIIQEFKFPETKKNIFEKI